MYIIYHPNFNLSRALRLFGLFRPRRAATVHASLPALHDLCIAPEAQATEEELLCVHDTDYLASLQSTKTLADIFGAPVIKYIPYSVLDHAILRPMRWMFAGTLLATRKAIEERTLCISLGGGFHHASKYRGHGFCAYADVSAAIELARAEYNVQNVLVIDVDAHEGDGHQTDYKDDTRVYTIDMYNDTIYPGDLQPKSLQCHRLKLKEWTDIRENTEDQGASVFYSEVKDVPENDCISNLESAIEQCLKTFDPGFVIYIAGTDVLDGDPLGRCRFSIDGVVKRDQLVVCLLKGLPMIWLAGGGYTNDSTRAMSESISNARRCHE